MSQGLQGVAVLGTHCYGQETGGEPELLPSERAVASQARRVPLLRWTTLVIAAVPLGNMLQTRRRASS